jgi:ABC-2 type transport system ATP-binding protein
LNGAGKSTALRILACLLLPSAGKVTLNNLDILENPHEIRKQVGFLPDIPPLYLEMTVESYLMFAGELRGMSRRHVKSRVEEVLEVTHTKDVRSDMIANLSHGYRQRVGIGQAIVHQPSVLILDEPTSGLDPVQIVEMREMIRGLKGRHTILLSSHILPEISQTCDRIMVINNGQIVATGTEEDLTREHRLNITVRGQKDKVTELVKAQKSVTEVKITGQVDGVIHLSVTTEQDLRETLSREIVQAGFGLLKLTEAELESIFIQLTQRKEMTQ